MALDQDAIPDQRPALRRLREAVAGARPSTIDEILNGFEGPATPELFIGQADLLTRIDEALAS